VLAVSWLSTLLLKMSDLLLLLLLQCMPWMMLHVKNLSAGNPVAEVFLIGWAFACTIEVSRCLLQLCTACGSAVTWQVQQSK
jgi:hypothetical protein